MLNLKKRGGGVNALKYMLVCVFVCVHSNYLRNEADEPIHGRFVRLLAKETTPYS